MSSYNLLTDELNVDDTTEEDEAVFTTCLSKMAELVGLEQEMLLSLVPKVTSSCTNISRLAHVMYTSAQPLDLDKVAPPELAVPLYGVASPVFIVVGLVVNMILVALLVREKVHSPTSVFLGGMAVLDGLTGMLQLPFLIYAYVVEKHKVYPDMTWCRIYWYMCRLVPMTLHTAALWLTMLLALQRHLGVRRSSRRTRPKLKCVVVITSVLCSVKGALISSIACVIAATLLHTLQLAFLDLVSVKVVAKDVLTSDGLHIVDTCSLRLKDESLDVAYNCVLTLVRLLLAELCPCAVIATCNLLLIRTTRRSSLYLRNLVQGHRASVKQESRATRRTTAMLLAVTTTSLLAELFVAAILVMEFAHTFKSNNVLPDHVMHELGVVSNFIITVTFPANFIIYCGMSRRVRRLVKSVVSAPCRQRQESERGREHRNGRTNVYVVDSQYNNEAYTEI